MAKVGFGLEGNSLSIVMPALSQRSNCFAKGIQYSAALVKFADARGYWIAPVKPGDDGRG